MKYAKAYLSAAIAGLSSLYYASDEGITLKEGIGVAIVTLSALIGTAAVKNKRVPPKP